MWFEYEMWIYFTKSPWDQVVLFQVVRVSSPTTTFELRCTNSIPRTTIFILRHLALFQGQQFLLLTSSSVYWFKMLVELDFILSNQIFCIIIYRLKIIDHDLSLKLFVDSDRYEPSWRKFTFSNFCEPLLQSFVIFGCKHLSACCRRGNSLCSMNVGILCENCIKIIFATIENTTTDGCCLDYMK